jgi:translation initiation factor IF-2
LRLKDIAYEIGITRQELRQELQKTNFGVDINARDIPDGLAYGIIRFLAPRYKKQKKELMRKEAARQKAEEMEGGKEEEITENEQSVKDSEDSSDKEEETPKVMKVERTRDLKGPLVFRASQEIEEKRKKYKEESRQKIEKAASAPKEQKKTWKRESPHSGGVNVVRKIEFTDDERKQVQKKKKKKGVAQEQKHKSFKRFKAQMLPEQDLSPEEQISFLAEEEMRRKLEDESFKLTQAKRKAKVQRQQKIDEDMIKKDGVIEVPAIVSVKEFSEKMGIPIATLVSTLMKNGVMGTINTDIDFETWLLLSDELDINIKREESEHSIEEILEGDLQKLMEDDPENLEGRPPVIVVMGHVDHGKTSILDYYRNSKVVDKESGGITQHIGAYQVEKKGKVITFLDTPGHEAFTSMRARGAKVTDITILVVAADEGIKEQTREAYSHAHEAGVPIIVAINKVDKEGANLDRVKGELMELGLVSEDYGGDTMMIPVSALTGEGMDNLLDSILLQSEIKELKANPNRFAIATVVESNLDKALGALATLVVNTGTLKVGDTIIAGSKVGKVRTMQDWSGKKIKSIGPSGAVQISGFVTVPSAGDIVQVVANEKIAKERAQKVRDLLGEREGHTGLGMSEIISRIHSGKMNLLKVVLKADTHGSIEAIRQMLAKIQNEEVGVKIIHAGVGNISESDVMMAAASQGVVFGFQVSSSKQVSKIAERENVELQIYEVIYNLMDDIRKILTGMLTPEELEIESGAADIKAIFMSSKKKQIIGAKVTSGVIRKGAIAKIFRNDELIYTTNISNLRSFEKNVSEVKVENECGIQLPQKFDLEEGDKIICITTEQKMKTL